MFLFHFKDFGNVNLINFVFYICKVTYNLQKLLFPELKKIKTNFWINTKKAESFPFIS